MRVTSPTAPQQMAALLRNPFHHAGVLDKRQLSSRPVSPAPPPIVDFLDKPTASHNEHTALSHVPVGGTNLNPNSPRLPPGSWDSHMHIIDPERYPLSPTAIYKPSKFTVAQAVSFESSIGASNIVIVQPSIYENDNSCLLDALRILGPGRARGVVAFDPDTTTPQVLQDWHRLGVRGVRINLQSTAQTMDNSEMETVLHRYADAVRALGWVIQLYIPMGMVTALERVVPALGGVKIVIDHLGSPEFSASSPCSDPYTLDGFASLVRLLVKGNTYVKMSAPYRLSKRDDYIRDVEPVALEILRVAGKTNVVFATDWPHTRFEGLDIRPWIEHVMNWCNDNQSLTERVFKGNAEELWA